MMPMCWRRRYILPADDAFEPPSHRHHIHTDAISAAAAADSVATAAPADYSAAAAADAAVAAKRQSAEEAKPVVVAPAAMA